jgi:hypothetical protein
MTRITVGIRTVVDGKIEGEAVADICSAVVDVCKQWGYEAEAMSEVIEESSGSSIVQTTKGGKMIHSEEDFIKIDTREFHGHSDYLDLTLDELELHSAKNRDYARFGNPLGNFYRVSDALKAQGINLSPTEVAIVFAQKQQDVAIQMLSHGYEGEVEDFDKRARDVHIYWKIARILHKEGKDEVSGQP